LPDEAQDKARAFEKGVVFPASGGIERRSLWGSSPSITVSFEGFPALWIDSLFCFLKFHAIFLKKGIDSRLSHSIYS
jgi:hypothetical protein